MEQNDSSQFAVETSSLEQSGGADETGKKLAPSGDLIDGLLDSAQSSSNKTIFQHPKIEENSAKESVSLGTSSGMSDTLAVNSNFQAATIATAVQNPAKVQLVAGKFEVVRVSLPPNTPAVIVSSVLPSPLTNAQSSSNAANTENIGSTHATANVVVIAQPQQAKEKDTVEVHKEVNEDSDDEDDVKENKHKVIETSPCTRYHKRRERVMQREVPGIDAAFLAMDTEEGKEVVWNEVQFSEKKNFKEKEEQIHQIFDNLINLHHPSILKFNRWWTDVDVDSDKPRVIFITEHISSGSLNHFIKTSKHNTATAVSNQNTNQNGIQANLNANPNTYMPEKSWKRWSRQILTALNYLHTAKPPIVHGNLNLDTVFLQHNGLIKIGCVAPDAIHQHVRTCREHINVRNMHFVAPEYAIETILTPAADIYSFGVLTLEMLIYGIHPLLVREKENAIHAAAAVHSASLPSSTSSISSSFPISTTNPINTNLASASTELYSSQPSSLYPITSEMVNMALETLEDGPVKQVIRDCLHPIPEMRPSAKNLLFHRAFFEVPPLKQIAAFAFVDYFSADHLDNWNDLAVSYGRDMSAESIIAENPRTKQVFRVSQLQSIDLDKYLEDVRQGVYPLTAWGVESPTTSLLTTPAQSTRDEGESFGLGDDFEEDFVNEVETRLIMACMCTIRGKHDSPVASLEVILRMEDKMNRHLMCDFDEETDSADSLAEELLEYGLINDQDQDNLAALLEATMRNAYGRKNDSLMDPQMLLQQQNQPTSLLTDKTLLSNGNGIEDGANSDGNNGLPISFQLSFPRNPNPTLMASSSEVCGWDIVFRSPVTTFNALPTPQTAPRNDNIPNATFPIAESDSSNSYQVTISPLSGTCA